MESRKRLRPWLWKHTEAGDFGLKWINKNEEIFRVPWIHRSSRNWNKDHCQVFKEWARFTNKYRDGDGEDWPGWKTRLRTALTKLRDFEEVSELHRLDDVDKPYKAYRFVKVDSTRDVSDSASSSGYSPSSSQTIDCSPVSSNPSPGFDALSPYQEGIHPSDFQNTSTSSGLVGACNIPNIPNILETPGNENLRQLIDIDNNIVYNAQITAPNESMMISPPESFGTGENSNSIQMNSVPSDLASVDSGNLVGKLPSSEMNILYDELSAPPDEKPQQNPQPNPVSKQPQILYKVFYLDEVVAEGTLYKDHYHFYFGKIPDIQLPDKVFGPGHMVRMPFPDVTNLKRSINSEQQQLIQKILLQMDRGFFLACNEGDIYAQRLCRTRIYANSLSMENHLLDRTSKKPIKIFDLKQFRENFLDKIKRPPIAILTFAQELKLDVFKTVLMRVELTSVEGQKHFPSLTSNQTTLHFSGMDSGDQLIHQMRSLNMQNN